MEKYEYAVILTCFQKTPRLRSEDIDCLDVGARACSTSKYLDILGIGTGTNMRRSLVDT